MSKANAKKKEKANAQKPYQHISPRAKPRPKHSKLQEIILPRRKSKQRAKSMPMQRKKQMAKYANAK